MKTILFGEKLYAIRDWLELRGRDWDELANCLGLASIADADDSLSAAIGDIIKILAPDSVDESEAWNRETRAGFFLVLVAGLPDHHASFAASLQRAAGAMHALRRERFVRSLESWLKAE